MVPAITCRTAVPRTKASYSCKLVEGRLSCLVSDELARRGELGLLFPPLQQTFGKSHLAHAIGQAAIQQGYRVLYRETHALLDELAHATLDGTRKEHMEVLVTVPLLIIDDLGCASCRLPPPGNCWRSSCAGTSGPAPY